MKAKHFIFVFKTVLLKPQYLFWNKGWSAFILRELENREIWVIFPHTEFGSPADFIRHFSSGLRLRGCHLILLYISF